MRSKMRNWFSWRNIITSWFVAVIVMALAFCSYANAKFGQVVNKTMTSANTEYSVVIPNGVSAITIQNRGSYDTKISFTSGESGTVYYTLRSGATYYETLVSSYNNVVYAQCAQAAQVLEIIYWYN